MSEIFNLYTLCRCCHADGVFKNLQSSYLHGGCVEVYSTMLQDTFNISIGLPAFEASYAICDDCIVKLRDASQFKQLVRLSEQKFEEYCENEQAVTIKEEPIYGSDDETEATIVFDNNNIKGGKYDCTGENNEHFDWDNVKEQPYVEIKTESVLSAGDNVIEPLRTDEERTQPVNAKPIERPPKRKPGRPKTSTLTRAEQRRESNKRYREKLHRKLLEESVKRNAEKELSEPAETATIEYVPQKKVKRLVYASTRSLKAKAAKETAEAKTKLDPDFETIVRTEKGYHSYRCQLCGSDYHTLKSLRNHITLKHKEAYKCPMCSETFRTRLKYLAHKKKHELPTEKCEICQKVFANKHALNEHMTKHTKAKNFRCDLCQKAFGYKQSLRRHIERHHGVKTPSFMCDLCGHSFNDVTNMNIHIQTVHEKARPFECTVCAKTFTRKKHLKGHMSQHTGEWSFKCDECLQGFSCAWRLKRHKLKKHARDLDGNELEAKRGYACGICERSFETRSKLLWHKRRHIGVQLKSYGCHLCPRDFLSHYTLKRHIDKHNGIKAFACDVCDERFTLKYHLLKHKLNIHHPDGAARLLREKVKCDLCNRRFRDIQKHMETHETRPFSCEFCAKSYPEKSALNRHIKRAHVKPRTFACDRCDQRYAKLRTLNLHVNKMHKIKKEEEESRFDSR